MTNEECLKKAIEKAENNGFDKYKYVKPQEDWFEWVKRFSSVIIFSHDFAKAFWGEKEVELPNPEWCDDMPVFDEDLSHDTLPAWQYHLQEMVLEKEPLKYLEKFLS